MKYNVTILYKDEKTEETFVTLSIPFVSDGYFNLHTVTDYRHISTDGVAKVLTVILPDVV